MDVCELALEILNWIDDAVVIADPVGAIIFVNQRAEQLTGCVLPEILGRPVSAYWGEKAPWRELFDRILETGQVETLDGEFVDPEGVRRLLLLRIFPLKTPIEATRVVCIMGRDVSHVRSLEMKLAEKGKALHDHLEETEALVSSLAHDLRTPLISIQGFANLLGKKYGDRLDEKGMEYLDRLKREADRMDRLVQDLRRPGPMASPGASREDT